MNYLNKIIFVSLLFSFTVLTAQDNRESINGSVKHNESALQFINIQNLATDKGTVSDSKGSFSINAKKGDTILFSSLVYQNRKIIITKTHILNEKIEVFLESGVNELEEVFLKDYVKPNFSNIAVHKNTILDDDDFSNSKKGVDMAKALDPVKAQGIGLVSVIQALTKNFRLKKKEKKNLLNEIDYRKKQLPYLIKQKFGNELFTKTLKIEEDKIEIFIEYCQDNGLDYFYESPDIEIINFLVIQSKKFNKITN
jgi:hypothetical protein